jgi:hypothetical protein
LKLHEEFIGVRMELNFDFLCFFNGLNIEWVLWLCTE